MKVNLIDDLSQLTTLPTKYIYKLIQKELMCINNAVEEALLNHESDLEITMGIGKLHVSISDGSVKYMFEPSKELASSVNNTVLNERNLLIDTLETTLVSRLTNTYKDLI